MDYFKPINGVMQEMKMNSAIRDRRIFINGTINEDTSFETCYFLNRLKDIDDMEGKPYEERLPIYLIINSYGGSVIWGNAILGVIEHFKSLGYEIIGVVQGFAYSMAFDILITCSKRYGYKMSDYMLHQTQTGYYPDDLVSHERDIEYTKRQWEKSVDYYVANTKISRERIKEVYEKRINWFMDANEAIQLGIIDQIL